MFASLGYLQKLSTNFRAAIDIAGLLEFVFIMQLWVVGIAPRRAPFGRGRDLWQRPLAAWTRTKGGGSLNNYHIRQWGGANR